MKQKFAVLNWLKFTLFFFCLIELSPVHGEIEPLDDCLRWTNNPKDFASPTEEEITRAFTIKGAPGWGHQMRKDKNVRLLCVGGSQTAEAIPNAMVPLLDLWLKKEFSNDSYALNRGRGSTMPAAFVGQKYDWEDWETSKWPNVMMIDFTLNTLTTDGWSSVKSVDKIIRGVHQKYLARDLPIPDVYFLELALIRGFYVDHQTNPAITFDQALQRYNNLSSDPADSFFAGNGFDRGCVNCAYFNSLAQFYGYPVVSYRDATWPAFMRHHLRKPNEKWGYSSDYIHLSIWGRFLLHNYMFMPFFKKAMAPRESDATYKMPSKYSHYYEHDLRMFAPDIQIKQLAKWQSWGNERNTLRGIIVSNKNDHQDKRGWHFTSTPGHHHDKGHICYGSKKQESTAIFNVRAPIDCVSSLPCAVQISSIYSWNATHFGSMECSVFRADTGGSGVVNIQQPLTKVPLESQVHNGLVIRNTLPLDTVLYSSITAGEYQIHCTKTDNKHSCISAISLQQEQIAQ